MQNYPQILLSKYYNTLYLEIDLSEKFNLKLRYILIRASDPDNQDDVLYKASFNKLIDILQSNNFITTENRHKLWGLVPRRSVFK